MNHTGILAARASVPGFEIRCFPPLLRNQGGQLGLQGQIAGLDLLHGGLHVPAAQNSPGYLHCGKSHLLLDFPGAGMAGDNPFPQGSRLSAGRFPPPLQLRLHCVVDFPAVAHFAHSFLYTGV